MSKLLRHGVALLRRPREIRAELPRHRQLKAALRSSAHPPALACLAVAPSPATSHCLHGVAKVLVIYRAFFGTLSEGTTGTGWRAWLGGAL